MNAPLLEIESLAAGYSQILFKDVCLNVRQGEFVTLMGENGAGKTTLFECLLGNQKPKEGSIRFFGKEDCEWSREDLHRQVAWVLAFQETYPPMLKIGRLLKEVSKLYPVWDSDLEERLLKGFRINRGMVANQLSLGERAKLKLIRALCVRPKLMICDELTANLSPESKKHVTETLIELLDDHKTSVLYSCHSPDEAVRLSDRIYTLIGDGLTEKVLEG